jgi:hypothetical protein
MAIGAPFVDHKLAVELHENNISEQTHDISNHNLESEGSSIP